MALVLLYSEWKSSTIVYHFDPTRHRLEGHVLADFTIWASCIHYTFSVMMVPSQYNRLLRPSDRTINIHCRCSQCCEKAREKLWPWLMRFHQCHHIHTIRRSSFLVFSRVLDPDFSWGPARNLKNASALPLWKRRHSQSVTHESQWCKWQNCSCNHAELILKARVVEDALNRAQDEHWVGFAFLLCLNADLWYDPRNTTWR